MNIIENTGKHLRDLIERVGCGRHQVPKGVPCYHLPKNVRGDGGYYPGACGVRIKKGGFVGKISPQSMRTKAPMKKDADKNTGRSGPHKKPNTRPASFSGKK